MATDLELWAAANKAALAATTAAFASEVRDSSFPISGLN